ncbi:DUF3265 domain-containing protein [Vibrio parahaemolyticus]|nr:DUF3265 domain-containing protein [Vibrio parahaemolyticus]EGR3159718.1 DUF3265 domain-containing protein [Vibrio parahaemolyticus]
MECCLTKHLRGIHNARQFWFELALVFTAQWFSLGGGVVHPLMRRYMQWSSNEN